MEGLKIPLRAISIIPLENRVPVTTPTKATAKIILKGAAFEPTAELRKFTASFPTPTIRSTMANRNKNPTMTIYRLSIK